MAFRMLSLAEEGACQQQRDSSNCTEADCSAFAERASLQDSHACQVEGSDSGTELACADSVRLDEIELRMASH